jgi:hypothetical protein
MTRTIAVTQLPYMGKHTEPKTKLTREPLEISMSSLRAYEVERLEARITVDTDPYEILTKKVKHLAQLLSCSEADAERVLFERVGK